MDTHFKCNSNGTSQAFCILSNLRCNGFINCPGGEDEKDCSKLCAENEV